jgi:hypothetical protein
MHEPPEKDELQLVAEAWRRARLAGRPMAIGTYDFPPRVTPSTAERWIRRDEEHRRSRVAFELESKRKRLQSSELPISLCGDMIIVNAVWVS